MKSENEKNQKSNKARNAQRKKIVPAAEAISDEGFSNELNEPRWSLVSFETCLASNLTYEQAVRKMEKAAAEKVSGLCIITDEAARKINDNRK